MAGPQANSDKKESSLVKLYLFSYNAVETAGWCLVLVQLVTYYLGGTESSLYEHLKWPLIIFQNAAILETIHAATRIVPSNPVVTLQQVFSRVMLVCGVIIPTIAGKSSVGLPLAVLAWSVTEIIRYAFYALNLLNIVPHFLIWLRYTTFIILYPIGVTGELLCMYAAQQEIGETGMWSVTMPNAYNFIFNYRYYLILIMLAYGPLFPQLYLHMFTLRKKVLGGGTTKKTK